MLAKKLYRTSFIWVHPNDDNRAADGRALRRAFIDECCIEDIEVNWLAIECSVLEMFIALADKTAFDSQGTMGDWFWKFITNLDIKYPDAEYTLDCDLEVERVLERFMYRKYRPNGVGGIFPLTSSRKDQRREELWYQMSAYLLEDEHAITG
jgi:hypothetical protein